MDQLSDLAKQIGSMPRPDIDRYFLLLALLASTRGTCARRRVGCVLVDRQHHVISTGYNGVAAGTTHCIDQACAGARMPSGTGLQSCEALHAEENALIQCTRPNDIHTVYCTASPCIYCVRRLMNTGATHIVFAEVYPHPESETIWCNYGNGGANPPNGRTWTHLPLSRSPSTENILAALSVRGPR